MEQAVGATTPAFTALTALLLLGKWESAPTYAALLPVIGGSILNTGFEPSFHLAGFGASIGATACRSLKAVVQVSCQVMLGAIDGVLPVCVWRACMLHACKLAPSHLMAHTHSLEGLYHLHAFRTTGWEVVMCFPVTQCGTLASVVSGMPCFDFQLNWSFVIMVGMPTLRASCSLTEVIKWTA